MRAVKIIKQLVAIEEERREVTLIAAALTRFVEKQVKKGCREDPFVERCIETVEASHMKLRQINKVRRMQLAALKNFDGTGKILAQECASAGRKGGEK